ncbi:hypothetical protein [Microcoleus sp. B7-D4]|uniref:hypothetical protein n=1 Tax=Microcoleus sp. B7-D4 TaxID=2818696 RepID=UPI002FCE7864
MAYFQASELLKNPEASLEDLLVALEDLGVEYGYIVAMTTHGMREDSEIDLVRILLLIKAIKLRVQQQNIHY